MFHVSPLFVNVLLVRQKMSSPEMLFSKLRRTTYVQHFYVITVLFCRKICQQDIIGVSHQCHLNISNDTGSFAASMLVHQKYVFSGNGCYQSRMPLLHCPCVELRGTPFCLETGNLLVRRLKRQVTQCCTMVHYVT